MHETTYKYQLPVNLSKAKLVCYPFATTYYSNVFTVLQNYTHFLQFTYKVDQKCQNLENLPGNCNYLHERFS